jgi:hypothetical protein
MRPADAYDRLVRGRLETVEIDELMNRILGVMLVPYPPGIPVIMPGERLTKATQSIYDYLIYAREFDTKFPGFETDIHGLRFEPTETGRRYLVDCVAKGAEKRSRAPSSRPRSRSRSRGCSRSSRSLIRATPRRRRCSSRSPPNTTRSR